MKIKIPISVAAALLLVFGAGREDALAQAPATPGPEHELLKKFEGSWTTKGKIGEEETTGSMTYKMELGGLWLSSKYEGSMFGQKFEGRGMDTYDRKSKKY